MTINICFIYIAKINGLHKNPQVKMLMKMSSAAKSLKFHGH